jgi:hypothetical protein
MAEIAEHVNGGVICCSRFWRRAILAFGGSAAAFSGQGFPVL